MGWTIFTGRVGYARATVKQPLGSLLKGVSPTIVVRKGMRADILSALGPIVKVQVNGKKLGVMEREVTVGLFARFVKETKYEITGHSADNLKGLIADPSKANDALYYVSFDDGVKLIEWLRKETGREWDFLTEEEFLAAKATNKLKSKVFWNWVKDFYNNTTARVLLSVVLEVRSLSFPELRFNNYGLRLVDRTCNN